MGPLPAMLLVLALAEPGPVEEHRRLVELHYVVVPGGETCPEEDELRRAITGEIGYDPFVPGSELQVTVTIRPGARAMEGELTWRDAAGQESRRRFAEPGRDCSDLVRAMVFAILVQLQLLGAPSPPQPAPLPGPVEPSSPPGPAVPPPPAPSPPWRAFVGLGALASWGTAPGIEIGGRAFGSLRRGAVSLEVGGEIVAPSTWQRDDGSGFRATSIAGTLAPCGHLGSFAACGLLRGGRLRVTGFGVDQPESASAWLAQTGVRLAATRHLGWGLIGGFHVDVTAALTRPSIELAATPAWRAPPFAILAGIDIAASIP